MILFIDTEWADVLASELVSLALVSDCGRYEFYAERDPLPDKPTDFVRSVVYPLLERGTRALPDEKFTAALHRFFDEVLEVAWRGQVLVAFDHRNDMALLDYALDGFESSNTPQRAAVQSIQSRPARYRVRSGSGGAIRERSYITRSTPQRLHGCMRQSRCISHGS